MTCCVLDDILEALDDMIVGSRRHIGDCIYIIFLKSDCCVMFVDTMYGWV